ncbi:MAG TPA: MFS transporter, partial [Streptomyces sp.]|nr:MFS transporter [Streptomyces sp.]
GVGALALFALTVPRPAAAGDAPASLLTEMRQGWTEFRSRAWLWVTTAQMGLFNLLVWAPFLVLGPLTADRRLGGAWAWGVIMAVYGGGAVVGGLLMLGRRPARPLVVATAAGLVWGLPSGALAAGANVAVTACAAGVAGVGSAIVATLYASTNQQHVPQEALGRVMSFGSLGAFVLGPVGLAAAGPVAEQVGVAAVLAFGLVWQLAASTVVLTVPAIHTLRAYRSPPGPRPAGPADAAEPADVRA